MPKYNFLIFLVLLVIIVGSAFVFLRPKNIDKSETMSDNPVITDISSRYVEYNSKTFDRFSDKRRVLFFYANWCPVCRPADADFKTNSDKIPDDVVVIRVNYNDTETEQEEKELAKKHKVVYQHTYIQIDSDGNEITRWNGGMLKELSEEIKPVAKEIQAFFAIYTNDTFRIFTAPMYHNLSTDAYIEASAPNTIKVKKFGVTWGDFFSSLPFTLSHTCLTTGTGETFCTRTNGLLRFYLNGTEVKEFLHLVIQNEDRLLVTFGNESDERIKQQIEKLSSL